LNHARPVERRLPDGDVEVLLSFDDRFVDAWRASDSRGLLVRVHFIGLATQRTLVHHDGACR
jgi:hypothetical protein